MSFHIINQPFDGSLGDYIVNCLESSAYDDLQIIVAFAKNSGVLRLKAAMEAFRARGGRIHVHVGIDMDGTSYEALTTLLALVDDLYIVHAESDQTFHSKVYRFSREGESIVIVGSNNLTAGGLWTNMESCSITKVKGDESAQKGWGSEVSIYLRHLDSIDGLSLRIEEQADIDQLLAQGFVSKEAKTRMRRASRSKGFASDSSLVGLFAQRIPARLPQIFERSPLAADEEKPKPASITSQGSRGEELPPIERLNEDGRIIWFETRKMTGGSRNTLDLSKKALVARGNPQYTAFSLGNEREMKGGVQFFGIDPSEEDRVMDITINFNGVDYEGNTIKYPEGASANGTWRLQIKGVSKAGVKITEAFEQYYLTEKILAFTKVSDGYFFMSVFDASDLDDFVEVSKVVAFNGGNRNSRMLGIL